MMSQRRQLANLLISYLENTK